MPHDQHIHPPPPTIYFDGSSSRRHVVTLTFGQHLLIQDAEGATLASWAFGDLRRADAPSGILRLGNVTAPPLARLEIRDPGLAAQLTALCTGLDDTAPARHSTARIVGWSMAAAASVLPIAVFGLPLIAERLAPLLPRSFEQRLGVVVEQQVKTLLGDRVCDNPAGQAALTKLVEAVRSAGGLDDHVALVVLSSGIPNAVALPGGKVLLFSSLLADANDPDEIAAVIAHEFGHVAHHDNMKVLIHNGSASFLIGLLFGDLSGSGALVFATKTLITSSYSREAEYDADTFSIEVMQKLGRSPKGLGELLFRLTGKQGGSALDIVASHPLTEERRDRVRSLDAVPSGPPLLSDAEWQALRAICKRS
jgi:Zn-dependent protease with chaperone function